MSDGTDGGAAAELTPEFLQEHNLSPENGKLFQTKGFIKEGKFDFNAIGTGYHNLEKLVGSEKVALPPKDEKGARAWDKWDGWSQFGVPEKHEEYQFRMPEGQEATDGDKAFHGHMAPFLHKAKLSQWQLDVLSEGINGFSGGAAEKSQAQIAEQMKSGEDALRKQFGPDYDEKIALGDRFIAAHGGDQLVAELAKSGLGRSPTLIAAIIAAAEATAEDNSLPGDKGGSHQPDPAAAVSSLKGDKEFMAAYLNGSHPGHAEAVKRMNAAIDAQDAAQRKGGK
jgi:hypothetical protein